MKLYWKLLPIINNSKVVHLKLGTRNIINWFPEKVVLAKRKSDNTLLIEWKKYKFTIDKSDSILEYIDGYSNISYSKFNVKPDVNNQCILHLAYETLKEFEEKVDGYGLYK